MAYNKLLNNDTWNLFLNNVVLQKKSMKENPDAIAPLMQSKTTLTT